MPFEMTTQRAVRTAFWRENPRASRRAVRSHDGRGVMATTDTRVAFVDWLDAAQKAGRVSESLAERVTLTG